MESSPIRNLEDQATRYTAEKRYIEALESLKQVLDLKVEANGEFSEQSRQTKNQICDVCNLLAMVYLQQDSFDMSLSFLKQAQVFTVDYEQGKAITYNNLACHFRRIGKIRTALNYLQKAVEIENRLSWAKQPADTHINLCAVLSQLDRHDEALKHGMMAIVLLQDDILECQLANMPQKMTEDRLAVIAIAHHNIGVEYEHLRRNNLSIKAYKKARDFAYKHLTSEHQVSKNLENVYSSALKKLPTSPEKKPSLSVPRARPLTSGAARYSSISNRK